jgi:SAM-dependent methyltransferase
MTGDVGADWAGFYARTSGREPRPLLLTACELMGAGAGRLAVDLGCGSGIEALELLARGWSVVAIDREPAGLELLSARIPAGRAEGIEMVCASYREAELAPAHLIHAGFSLPFCPPEHFPGLWARIRGALLPGGMFAGQLFGANDSWAGEPGMVFHDLQAVEGLLRGLEIVQLTESERDGESSIGPKHWHVFDILAREPGRPELT